LGDLHIIKVFAAAAWNKILETLVGGDFIIKNFELITSSREQSSIESTSHSSLFLFTSKTLEYQLSQLNFFCLWLSQLEVKIKWPFSCM
jgi:hypothetical protein